MIANEHTRIGSNSYEKVKTFKCLGSLVTNQNSIKEEIQCKSRKVMLLRVFSPNTFVFSNSLRIWKLNYIKPVVLYGCEAWFLTLWVECRLKVIENRILRRILVSKRNANGEWRRLHNGELLSLYRSP